MKIKLLLISFLTLFAYANDSVESILFELGQKSDLSEKTKLESGGHLHVFTRQDLDRMQIRTLKELVDYVPFFRYDENAYGLTHMVYNSYQPLRAYLCRVYINDMEMLAPYIGSSLQHASHINMGYIDHVEIYVGIPSYRYNVEPANVSIRLYTKDPKRENTNLLGGMVGSRGSSEFFGYSAHDFGDLSYLLHVNTQTLNRDNPSINNNELSRDSQIHDVYAQFNIPKHTFEFQSSSAKKDLFIGKSWGMNVENNEVDFNNFHGTWKYMSEDESLRSIFSITSLREKYDEKANDALGFSSLGVPYSTQSKSVNELITDLNIYKTFVGKNGNTLAGIRFRYENFQVEDLYLDGTFTPTDGLFDRDFITSIYVERDYSLSDQHLLTTSFKIDDMQRNGGAKDEMLFSGRIGYIYNNQEWTWKSYLYMGEAAPLPIVLNEHLSTNPSTILKKERISGFSSEVSHKTEKFRNSLMLSRVIYENVVLYNVSNMNYFNADETFYNDVLDFKSSYSYDTKNRIDASLWYIHAYSHGVLNRNDDLLGGYLTLLNTFGKWDLSNSLNFYGLDYSKDNGAGYNYNVALTYRPSRNLSFFIKGKNLLDEAITTNYTRVNYLNGQVTTLNDVNVNDREVWFGFEYSF